MFCTLFASLHEKCLCSLSHPAPKLGKNLKFFGSCRNETAKFFGALLNFAEFRQIFDIMSLDYYEVGAVLARGTFSTITLTKERGTGRIFALKSVERSHYVNHKTVIINFNYCFWVISQ